MSYEIYITAAAERDFFRASDHIEFVLKNPKAADDLLDEAEARINALTEFPEQFQCPVAAVAHFGVYWRARWQVGWHSAAELAGYIFESVSGCNRLLQPQKRSSSGFHHCWL